MSRSSRQVVTLPLPRGGLALPTAVAAAVCGGSLLAIAATGAVALEGGEHPAVAVTAVGNPLDAPADLPADAVQYSNASGLPPAGAMRDSGRQGPIRRIRREPTQAATASQFTVEVRRPKRAAAVAANAESVIGGTDRAPLLSPQVVDPEAPTVVVVQDPPPIPPPATVTVTVTAPPDADAQGPDVPAPPTPTPTPSPEAPERDGVPGTVAETSGTP
jgi:hypothetical protein